MPAAETARLIASLELQDKFSGNAGRIGKSLNTLDRQIDGTQGRAYKAGTQIGVGIKRGAYIAAGAIGFLATQVGFGLKSLVELDDVVTQSNAVLTSTKGVAGQTAESVRNLAEKYEALNATIDDKVIQSGENLLLTFTNIRKEAFEPALLAALNMNKALGGGEEGLQGTVQKLGKALNDPIKGLTALGRVGITFTAQQKEQIKTAVEAGDTFKAQGIILAELDKRFGGSFLAGGQTTAGKVAKFQDAIDDLQRALARGLLPAITKVADFLSTALTNPKVIAEVGKLGDSIGSLFSDKNLAEGGKLLSGLFDTAKSAAPILKDAAGTMLTVVKAAVSAFRSLPEGIQQIAIGAFAINKLTGGLVTNVGGAIAGGIAEAILHKFAGIVNVNGAVVNVNGAGVPGGIPAAAPAAAGIGLGTAAAAVAVPVILAGGATQSLLKIQEFADQNALYAKQGLTQAEILAVRFYSANKADQERIFKLNFGKLPTTADLASANAKLANTIVAGDRRDKDDIVASIARGAAGTRDKIESGKIATVSALGRTQSAVSAAGARIAAEVRSAAIASRQTTEAIKDKDQSVTVPISIANRTTVTVNSRTVVKASTEFKKYFATTGGGPVPS